MQIISRYDAIKNYLHIKLTVLILIIFIINKNMLVRMYKSQYTFEVGSLVFFNYFQTYTNMLKLIRKH